MKLREMEASSQFLRYQTSKGSWYQVYPDGTTIRTKSFHPEHGVKDQGLQPRSQATVYLPREEANKLSLMQATMPDGVAVAFQLVHKPYWGVRFVEGPNSGKAVRSSMVQPSSKPKRDWLPVEVWHDGRVVHFGNEIIRIECDPQYTEYFRKWLQTP